MMGYKHNSSVTPVTVDKVVRAAENVIRRTTEKRNQLFEEEISRRVKRSEDSRLRRLLGRRVMTREEAIREMDDVENMSISELWHRDWVDWNWSGMATAERLRDASSVTEGNLMYLSTEDAVFVNDWQEIKR